MSPQDNNLLEKREMMDRLGEYDNLIKAIGALQFTSKYMSNNVPIIF